jgi:hypothetical protein
LDVESELLTFGLGRTIGIGLAFSVTIMLGTCELRVG